jgi:hypothetical protein
LRKRKWRKNPGMADEPSQAATNDIYMVKDHRLTALTESPDSCRQALGGALMRVFGGCLLLLRHNKHQTQ